MKIVLVITNSRRKSLVFVSSELDTYPLEKAIQLTREGKIEGAHTVQRDKNTYIRTNLKVVGSEKFDNLVDLSERPEIIGTLYALPYREPHGSPKPNERGLQVSGEFYQLSKRWL